MKKIIMSFVFLSGITLQANIVTDSLAQYRGHKAYSLGNFKKAEQEYLKLLSHDPYDPQANYNIGVCLYQQKKHEEAEHYFDRSAQHAKEKSKLQEQALFNQADALVKQHKMEPAVQLYEKVLKINPDNKDAWHNFAIVKTMLEQQKQQKQDQQNNDKQQKQDKQHKKDNEKSSSSKDQESSYQKSKDQEQASQDQQNESQKDKQRSDSGTSEHDKKTSKQDSEKSKQEQQSKDKNQKNGQDDSKGQQGHKQEQQKQQEQEQEKSKKNIADGLEKSPEKQTKSDVAQGKNEKEKNDQQHKKSLEKTDEKQNNKSEYAGKENEQEAAALKDELADDLLSKAGDDQRLDKRSMHIMQIMEDDEKNIQKQLLKMNVTKQGAKNHGQKNW